MYVLNSLLLMFGMSLILGVMIAIFSKVFEVKVDPRITQINEVLPAYNCGSCGFPGCSQYAEAVIAHHVPPNKCTPGGPDTAAKIRAILDAAATPNVTPAAS